MKNKRNGKDQTLIERLCNPNPVANARKGYRAGIIPGWNREREREREGEQSSSRRTPPRILHRKSILEPDSDTLRYPYPNLLLALWLFNRDNGVITSLIMRIRYVRRYDKRRVFSRSSFFFLSLSLSRDMEVFYRWWSVGAIGKFYV